MGHITKYDEEEGLYRQSLSGYLVEVAECQVEVWEISSGVAASCGELTTPWPRGDSEDDIGQRVPSYFQYK